ncbi:MAG TPA: glycosyltransferase [Mycobacterium sp.]|nr:glycosyltransferase [Mycobacterium sp.]
MLAAGGTGGHLFPAFALAEELGRRGVAVDLITDMRGDRYGGGFPARKIYQVPSATLASRAPRDVAKTVLTLARGTSAALRLLGQAKPHAVIGFGDMAATADTEMMRAKGISDAKFSRANDRRRLGFLEAQGGGTILLARGDLAVKMGLPVLGVVAYAQSFADGVHTSIPAPGLGALGAGRGGRESALARSLSRLGVGADDIAVISKHDTSTLANDPNETDLHERLADALGRAKGNPLFVVSQKSLTGHAKGGAAVFQLIGLCQILRDGVIPPNRSLDCVDDELAGSAHFVWPRQTLHVGGRLPLKAGLLTSLGFGHVSGLVALVHPQAFLAALSPEERAAYRERAEARVLAGQRRLASAMAGGRPLYERPADRRFDHDAPEKRQEAAMLLDPTARLDAEGAYRSGAIG